MDAAQPQTAAVPGSREGEPSPYASTLFRPGNLRHSFEILEGIEWRFVIIRDTWAVDLPASR